MAQVFGVNDGHTITGPGSGAVGIINESKETRRVGAEVRRLLKASGHNTINCTIDYAKTSNEALGLIVSQANRQDLDWFISIHFNASGGRGVEVYTYKGRQYPDAINVCKNISNLGFRNRGVKEGTGLYVIRKTKAKSMLIEVCFVDSQDANDYLRIGPSVIAKAIVSGIIGSIKEPSTVNPTTSIEGRYGIVTASMLNVRETNSTNSKIIKQLPKGTKIKIYKQYGKWYSIYPTGCVYSDYIQLI